MKIKQTKNKRSEKLPSQKLILIKNRIRIRRKKKIKKAKESSE